MAIEPNTGLQPMNFSWIEEGKVAGMAWPYKPQHLTFLEAAGIGHLVTLSADRLPPLVPELSKIRWTMISVEEFEPPTVEQIKDFISICVDAEKKKQAVGVHCWQGRGRTGVMLACYLVKFQGASPEMAISRVRCLRPGSVETYEQERIVVEYNDFLCTEVL